LAASFSTRSGGEATSFLAQALGVYVAEAQREAGQDESAEAHMRMVGLVDSYYPIPDEFRERFEDGVARLRSLTSATPYSPAGDFEPPYADHDMQVLNARDSYRQTMTFEGISIAIGDDELHSLSDLRYPGADMDFDATARSRGDQRWWNDAAEDWVQAVSAALSGGRHAPGAAAED
jgi:hypothetical protein